MSYLAVAIVIGMLIAIHEYGHLLAAKLCGIPVRRFSIGFGPKLFGFKLAETSYWFSLIPLGGYVLPALEDTDFRRLPAYKRITFALGGPIANIAGAFVGLFVLGLSQWGLGPIQAVSRRGPSAPTTATPPAATSWSCANGTQTWSSSTSPRRS